MEKSPETPTETSARTASGGAVIRAAMVDALRAAAPGAFDEAMRTAYLAGGMNIALADLGLDSLGRMEFCIAVELSTGVTLLPAQLAELVTTNAIERYIGERLNQPPSGGGDQGS